MKLSLVSTVTTVVSILSDSLNRLANSAALWKAFTNCSLFSGKIPPVKIIQHSNDDFWLQFDFFSCYSCCCVFFCFRNDAVIQRESQLIVPNSVSQNIHTSLREKQNVFGSRVWVLFIFVCLTHILRWFIFSTRDEWLEIHDNNHVYTNSL